LADFEPVIDLDAELPLHQVTPELFDALSPLEPFGQANPEPIFAAEGVRLMAPPRILKDKHAKLKLAPSQTVAPASRGLSAQRPGPLDGPSHSPAEILMTPRCHPDSAAFRRSEIRAASEHGNSKDENSNWRRAVTFQALAWHMAERLEQEKLLTGDSLDIAFTIGHNHHPEFGGLELTICDFKTSNQTRTAEQSQNANESPTQSNSATMP
jgi:RecJ OB domain